jgi:GAF domain-containing protein
MAAPVHEHGEVVGSLGIASYLPGRTFTSTEQEVLLPSPSTPASP